MSSPDLGKNHAPFANFIKNVKKIDESPEKLHWSGFSCFLRRARGNKSSNFVELQGDEIEFVNYLVSLDTKCCKQNYVFIDENINSKSLQNKTTIEAFSARRAFLVAMMFQSSVNISFTVPILKKIYGLCEYWIYCPFQAQGPKVLEVGFAASITLSLMAGATGGTPEFFGL